jgi:uncharacterized protein
MTRGLAVLLCIFALGFSSGDFAQTASPRAQASPNGQAASSAPPAATEAARAAPADEPLASPSFDCATAKEAVDVLICHDEELAALDLKMAKVYRTEIETRPAEEVAIQKALQLEWMNRRKRCGKSKAAHACVKWNYERRIAELQIRAGETRVYQRVDYECFGSNKPLSAAFYQETDPPSALLTYGNDQVVAILRPSGSGAKYTASAVQFWDQQYEVLVTWSRKKLRCQPRTNRHP